MKTLFCILFWFSLITFLYNTAKFPNILKDPNSEISKKLSQLPREAHGPVMYFSITVSVLVECVILYALYYAMCQF